MISRVMTIFMPRTRRRCCATKRRISGDRRGRRHELRRSLAAPAPAVEIIAVHGVGYDGVPVDYCRQRGIRVTNTPDVLTEDVADIALALVLMTSRRLIEANRFLHAGRGGRASSRWRRSPAASARASSDWAASARPSRGGWSPSAWRSVITGAKRRRTARCNSFPRSSRWRAGAIFSSWPVPAARRRGIW